MAADSTLVSAAFKSTPKVLDQTPLYQASRRMGQQALGLVVGAMKKLDDKKEKQKLGAEQQLKGFDRIANNNLRKLYAQEETLPNKIVFAIEEEVKRLQTEFEEVNTYGDNDTSENERARVKIEAQLQKVINEAINARAGFMKISENIKNLNVDQISRNAHNIDPMRTVIDLENMDINDNVNVSIKGGNLTYTTSNYKDDGAGNLSGDPVYMTMSDMQKYLPAKNKAHTIMVQNTHLAAVKQGKDGGVDGEYDYDAIVQEIVSDGSIAELPDFQSAMDQKNPINGLSFTRSLYSNAKIPLNIIENMDLGDKTNNVAKRLAGEDGILDQSEIEGASEADLIAINVEGLIDVISNTTHPLFSPSISKQLYAEYVADINLAAHGDEINKNIERSRVKTTKTSNYLDTSFGSISKTRARSYVDKVLAGEKEIRDLRGNDWELQSDGSYKSGPYQGADKKPYFETRTAEQMISQQDMDAHYPDIYNKIVARESKYDYGANIPKGGPYARIDFTKFNPNE